jgi:hypothetical protein
MSKVEIWQPKSLCIVMFSEFKNWKKITAPRGGGAGVIEGHHIGSIFSIHEKNFILQYDISIHTLGIHIEWKHGKTFIVGNIYSPSFHREQDTWFGLV